MAVVSNYKHIHRDLISSLIFLAFSAAMFYRYYADFKKDLDGTFLFPILAISALAGGAILLIIKSLLGRNSGEGVSSGDVNFEVKSLFRTAIFLVILYLYVKLFTEVDFILLTAVLVFLIQLVFGNKSIVRALIVSLVTPIVIYTIFSGLFKISLTSYFF